MRCGEVWGGVYCEMWGGVYCEVWGGVYCEEWGGVYCEVWGGVYCEEWGVGVHTLLENFFGNYRQPKNKRIMRE